MSYQIAMIAAIAPIVGGAVYFIWKALGWRKQLAARELELARAQAEIVERSLALKTAGAELEKFTKFLEKRVDERTRELKAAQDEITRLRGKKAD